MLNNDNSIRLAIALGLITASSLGPVIVQGSALAIFVSLIGLSMGLLGTLHTVRRLMPAETELRSLSRRYGELQRTYENIFCDLPAGLIKVSDDGRILACNHRLLDQLGYFDEIALVGLQVDTLFPVSGPGFPKIGSKDVHAMIRRSSGDLHPVRIGVVSVPMESSTSILIFVNDEQEVVRLDNERLAWLAVVEAASTWVLQFNANHQLIYLNPAARRALGNSLRSAGRTGPVDLDEVITITDANEVKALISATETGSHSNRKLYFRTDTGQFRTLVDVIVHRCDGEGTAWYSLVASPYPTTHGEGPACVCQGATVHACPHQPSTHDPVDSPQQDEIMSSLSNLLQTGQQELDLYFQPQVECPGNRIVGVECLLRWRHPEFGTISPLCFVPLAEHAGLAYWLDNWVLDTALGHYSNWQASGIRTRMAINISACSLSNPDFADAVDRLLDKHRVPASLIELEITESALIEHHDLATRNVQQLRQKGIGLALDDFGTGFASFARLQSLCFDRLKIDRRFVNGMASRSCNAAIVDATLMLGRLLGQEVVAEGVENLDDLALLERMGCTCMQGWLFYPAMDSASCQALLLKQQASTVSFSPDTSAASVS